MMFTKFDILNVLEGSFLIRLGTGNLERTPPCLRKDLQSIIQYCSVFPRLVPTVYSEDVWGVNPRKQSEPEGLVPVLGAPHVGRAHPEGLSLGVGQAGQPGLRAVSGLPGLWISK